MYECDECDKNHFRKDGLPQHKKTVHSKKFAIWRKMVTMSHEPFVTRQNAIVKFNHPF